MTEEDYANPATKEILGKLFAWSKHVVALLRLPFNKDKAGKSLTHIHLGRFVSSQCVYRILPVYPVYMLDSSHYRLGS